MKKDLNLAEKQLLSQAFDTFNKSIDKLRKYQAKLEKQIKQLTNEVSLKNQELINILESLNNGLIVTDLDGKVIRFNQAAEEILEIQSLEAIGSQVNNLTSCKFLPEKLGDKELEQVSRSFHQEQSLINSKEKKIILESETTLMRGKDHSEPLGIIININDVTLLKSLQEESDRKNRMVAMGQIAANVAHEIRNPLGSIELFVSILKIDLSEDEEKASILNHIHSGVRSMNHIISNILQYSKPRPINLNELDLAKLLDEFIQFNQHMAKHHNVKVEYKNLSSDSLIKGDQELLKQVFQNVMVNALQAMPEGGNLEITLSEEISYSRQKMQLFKKVMLEGQNELRLVSIIFKDTGKGMPKSVVKQVFDPFFTTKEKGTGLGMYIIRNIIDSHEGLIQVDSEVGKGTEVSIQFATLN